jgi:hypothetical protein
MKWNFYHEKYRYLKKVKGKTTYLRRYRTKAFLEGRKPGLFVNVGQFPSSWILIRIPNTDPDPRQPKECGSRIIRIRIYNTGGKSDGSYSLTEIMTILMQIKIRHLVTWESGTHFLTRFQKRIL